MKKNDLPFQCAHCEKRFPASATFVLLSRGQQGYLDSGWTLSDFKPFALLCEACGEAADAKALAKIRELVLRGARKKAPPKSKRKDAIDFERCNACGSNLKKMDAYSAVLAKERLTFEHPEDEKLEFIAYLCFDCEDRARDRLSDDGAVVKLGNGYVVKPF